MAGIKCLCDEHGIINEAEKILPAKYKLDFLSALAELEDNDNHKHRTFPKTRLHKVTGISDPVVYRADIHKISGWRLHLQYTKAGCLQLRDIIEGQQHDDVIGTIKAKKGRYSK